MYVSQYTPPSDYRVPNPLGPRIHNWRGGLWNEGSLYHGPVYTRPDYKLPWMMRPLNGAEETIREGRILLFTQIVNELYPDLSSKLQDFRVRNEKNEGAEAADILLEECIKNNFSPDVFVSAQASIEDPEVLEQLFPRASVEATLECFAPRLSNLAIVLPILAGTALVVWLFARKR